MFLLLIKKTFHREIKDSTYSTFIRYFSNDALDSLFDKNNIPIPYTSALISLALKNDLSFNDFRKSVFDKIDEAISTREKAVDSKTEKEALVLWYKSKQRVEIRYESDNYQMSLEMKERVAAMGLVLQEVNKAINNALGTQKQSSFFSDFSNKLRRVIQKMLKRKCNDLKETKNINFANRIFYSFVLNPILDMKKGKIEPNFKFVYIALMHYAMQRKFKLLELGDAEWLNSLNNFISVDNSIAKFDSKFTTEDVLGKNTQPFQEFSSQGNYFQDYINQIVKSGKQYININLALLKQIFNIVYELNYDFEVFEHVI